MKYLVATDCVVDFLKGRPDAIELLRSIAGDGIGISIVTYGELWEGVAYGGDTAANGRRLRTFLRGVDSVGLNQRIMRRFAAIRGQLRRDGQLIGDFDTLIAATALHYDLILATRNLRHLGRIPGLRIHNLTER